MWNKFEKLWPRSCKGCLRPAASGSIFKFFTLRTDPEPFLSAGNWLTSGFAYATLSFNWLTRRLQNRFILSYFILFAFSSTVKFSKIVFPVWNFVWSLKYSVLRTKITTVSRCESLDLRFFLPQTEYQTAWKFVNLQKGSGKKTRLKSFFT